MAYKQNISSNLEAAKISCSLGAALPVVVHAAEVEQYKLEGSTVVTRSGVDVTGQKLLAGI